MTTESPMSESLAVVHSPPLTTMPDSAPVARAELVDVVEHPPTQTESVQPLPAETTDESRPAEAATATSHPSPESAVDGDTETPPKSAESPPNDDDDATASSIGFLLAETVTRRRKQPQPTKRPRGRPRKTPVSQARRKLSVLNKQTPTKRLAPVTTAFHPCKRCSARIAVTYANTPYIADGMILVNFCGECHAMALRLS